jgi:serine/threonine-protein kinase
MPLASGVTAAGFCITRQLEYAEFGELYVAEHPRLPRLQLLQLIPAKISADLDYREDFNQESDLAATLWHPNILGLTDRGELEDQLWISTDYLDGDDTAQLLGDNHPDGMPTKMVIEIVSAIGDALDYAHDRGVLHRYVNPGNILVSKTPADKRRIALYGFGVARPTGNHNTLTRPGVIIGTAGYTAPERLMDDAIDGRADQYGLAATAFHLLTGTPPFAHFNPAVVISKHLNERPPRPSDVRPDLTEFDAIFARALSQDPVDRFRRCRDFARALELNGGKRSHVRATTDLLVTSDHQDAGTTAVLATPTNNGVAPTEPAALAPPVTEVARAVDPPKAPPGPRADAATMSAEPAAHHDDDDASDDPDSDAARSRRKKQTAAIAGTILVVVVAWFVGVRALRSASQSDDTPTSSETTSAEPTAAPTIAIQPPMAPLPPMPPAPVMAPPPVVTSSAPVTTSKVASPVSTTVAPTTRASATSPKSTTPATTTPSGRDTRPALGMPCGPDQNGAAAVSNGGGPVNCVSTPGGFAWEPPGVQAGG